MAEILIDLNHLPTESDQSFLDEVLLDDESTEDEKTLARIIGRIAHKPGAEDVSTLVKLSGSKTPEIGLLADAILSINHQVSADKKAALQAMIGE